MAPASWRGSPLLLVLIAILLSAAWPGVARSEAGTDGAGGEHFLIEGAVSADRGNGIVLNLGSAILRGDTLELHVGFRNMAPMTVASYGELSREDFHLGEAGSLTEIAATGLSPHLEKISPPPGLPPRLANAGIVTFPAPARREGLQLRVSGFGPVPFSLSPTYRFAPPGPAERISTGFQLHDLTLKSDHRHLGIFALHVTGVRLDETRFIVDIEFENTSNRSFVLDTAGVSGKDAYFVDGNFEMHRPFEISEELRQSIGPVDARFEAGVRHAGTVTFERSHPHAMRRLLFSFPTFESLILTFDEATRTYAVDVAATGDPGYSTEEPHPLRVSGDLFRELGEQLASASRSLQEREVLEYLDRFLPGSEARTAQADFITGMSRLAPSRVSLALLSEQQLEIDEEGRLADVAAYFDYSLSLPGGERRFRSELALGFSKEKDVPGGGWLIDDWSFTKQPPCWIAGLTQMDSTPHFAIFHRPGIAAKDVIASTGAQLERAYELLEANGELRLEPSYVAFLIDRVEDFRLLTLKDPLRYHGAASTSYTIENDAYVALNLAMFINEFSFNGNSSRENAETRDQTIAHELAHLALANETRHFTPPWLTEGVAINLAGQLTPGSRRALLEAGGLPILSLSAMSRGSLPGAHLSSRATLNFEYIYAGEAVAYLIRTYGPKRFFEYYRSFAQITPSQLDALATEQTITAEGGKASLPKLMHQVTLELTRRHFGVSLYDLDTVVRSHISLQPR